MILSFKTQINGVPTNFVDKILSGQKIHTIRHGNRWQAGKTIQMATGVRTKYYNQFNKDRCDLQRCVSVQHIIINPNVKSYSSTWQVYVDGKRLPVYKVLNLSKKDGFKCVHDFFKWFNQDFEGQIVHWTDYKY